VWYFLCFLTEIIVNEYELLYLIIIYAISTDIYNFIYNIFKLIL